MNTCRFIHQQLDAFREGALDAAAEHAVREHLASCADCLALLTVYDNLDRRLRAALTPPPVPDGFMARCEAAWAPGDATAPAAGGGGWWIPASVAAAAAVLVAAAAIRWQGLKPPPPATAQMAVPVAEPVAIVKPDSGFYDSEPPQIWQPFVAGDPDDQLAFYDGRTSIEFRPIATDVIEIIVDAFPMKASP